MDVITFISELLRCLSEIKAIENVASQADGPTVHGRAYFQENLFLAFYYNQVTGTQAFALVSNEQRIWGGRL